MKKIALALVMWVAMSSCVYAAEVKQGQCLEKQWYEDFFAKHTLELSLSQDKKSVYFESDGQYGKHDGHYWLSQCRVRKGEAFEQSPDHHANAAFRLQKIQDDGVIIQYESRFDHRSFGKDLISIDTCSIKIPYIARRDVTDLMPPLNAGYYYVSQHDYDRAIPLFQKAVELEPENAGCYQALGDAYWATKDVQRARECYEKFIQLKPDVNELVYEKLGDVYVKLEKYYKAKENYRKALEIAQKIPREWYAQQITEKLKQLPVQ